MLHFQHDLERDIHAGLASEIGEPAGVDSGDDLGLVRDVTPRYLCDFVHVNSPLSVAGRDWHELVEGLIYRSWNEMI